MLSLSPLVALVATHAAYPLQAPRRQPLFFPSPGLGAYAITYPFLNKPWKKTVAGLQQYPLLNAIVKFGVAFPFAYHFAGGLRHLAWDNVMYHNLPAARTSGFAAIGFGAAVGLIAAVYEADA